MEDTDRKAARSLMFYIDWFGPWERLQARCYGIRSDGSLRWDIPSNPRGLRWVAGQLGDFFERRDLAWRKRHLRRRTIPWECWRRRGY